MRLTSHLHTFFPALAGADLCVDAATVADLVRAIDRLAPGFAFYVCDELGRLRPHVNVFVDRRAIRDRRSLSDPVEPGAEVFVLQALSGG